MTFESAGNDEDLHSLYLNRQINFYESMGVMKLRWSISLYRQARSSRQLTIAEQAGRDALHHLRNALNWAEDTNREEDVHLQMDKGGKFIRESFGCHFAFEDGTYYQKCPVALGHNRVGLSIGATATRICSLCGQDLSECEHLRGTAYLVPGGAQDLGHCRVCLSTKKCEHDPTKTYRASVCAKLVNIELHEVSLVNKPAHPEARIQSVSISSKKLKEQFGGDFKIGMPVSCDKCLGQCDGLIKHE